MGGAAPDRRPVGLVVRGAVSNQHPYEHYHCHRHRRRAPQPTCLIHPGLRTIRVLFYSGPNRRELDLSGESWTMGTVKRPPENTVFWNFSLRNMLQIQILDVAGSRPLHAHSLTRKPYAQTTHTFNII